MVRTSPGRSISIPEGNPLLTNTIPTTEQLMAFAEKHGYLKDDMTLTKPRPQIIKEMLAFQESEEDRHAREAAQLAAERITTARVLRQLYSELTAEGFAEETANGIIVATAGALTRREGIHLLRSP